MLALDVVRVDGEVTLELALSALPTLEPFLALVPDSGVPGPVSSPLRLSTGSMVDGANLASLSDADGEDGVPGLF